MKELNFGIQIIAGEGALGRLKDVAGKTVLIITDHSMMKIGTVKKVMDNLSNCSTAVFDDVIPDPPLEVVKAGVKALDKSGADTIIAVGGGSVIDTAKAIRMVTAHAMKCSADAWPLIAIPTTSGTGSEVTDYSVITDAEKALKYPLKNQELRATMAILDPELTRSVPPVVTADTGMDALTHALEAYISATSNDFSDALCEKAISYLFRYLPIAFKDGGNMEAREKVHIAACMAGIAFNEAGLGVNHGMAHAVGGKLHISHGRINAMLLPHVMRFNAELEHNQSGRPSVTAQKMQTLAKQLGLPANGVRVGAMNLIREIEKLNRTLKIPATLVELGKDPEEVESLRDEIVATALADATTQTNPRPVSLEQANEILTQLKGKSR